MEILSLFRTVGALALVLGMLAGALWVVRRYDVKLPGRLSATGRKRVELVERLSVDAKRSVALIRRDGCEHLILMGPEGNATIETGIAPPAAKANAAAFVASFGEMVDMVPPRAPRTPRGKRTRAPRCTARWNRAAVREALDA